MPGKRAHVGSVNRPWLAKKFEAGRRAPFTGDVSDSRIEQRVGQSVIETGIRLRVDVRGRNHNSNTKHTSGVRPYPTLLHPSTFAVHKERGHLPI